MITDNTLIEAFLPIINAGLIADGFKGVAVKQGNQPTQQGINFKAAVYFYKLSDIRYGFLHRSDDVDPESNPITMTHTESQVYETDFRVTALVKQKPNNTTLYTASDLINEVIAIMQSDATIAALFASQIQILRVREVRNPYFVDDQDNFEAAPSFDFTLTYSKTRTSPGRVVTSFTYDIVPV